MRSWISDGREDTRSVATRMLTVVLLGFSVGVYRNPSISWEESFIASDVDVSVDLRMSSAEVVVACRLSDLFVRLSYTEYSLICLILQENIGEKMKKERWDNVETEWENEVAENVNELSARSIFSNDVIYSSSARLVRYGRRNVSSTLRTLTVSLTLGTVSLVLQRDDGDLAVPYDMLLLEGQDFDFEIGRKEDGDEWLNLSLRRLFVFDLGKLGRHAHMSSSNEVDEADWSSRSVLVTGYSPAERTSGGSNGSEFESQIVIKIDKLHAPSNEIKVVFVVSFLSVAAFVGPTRDLVQFLSCKWPILSADYPPTRMVSEKTPTIESKISVAAPRQWNLRFVLHYPRLLFAADESDPHSRALVVRG